MNGFLYYQLEDTQFSETFTTQFQSAAVQSNHSPDHMHNFKNCIFASISVSLESADFKCIAGGASKTFVLGTFQWKVDIIVHVLQIFSVQLFSV